MVAVIDRKLNDKIKDQLNEINELQETINRLKEGNNVVSVIKSENFLQIHKIFSVCHISRSKTMRVDHFSESNEHDG